MPAFTEITPQNLMRLLGTPAVPEIWDVRLLEDRAEAPFSIPTARQLPFETAINTAPNGPVVIVCHRGKKISHGVAAHLRAKGFAAEVLSGGSVAWAEADLPRIPLAVVPARPVWVTRHRPKIDRIACPWLLRRWVDPATTILFVQPSEVMAVAERFGATPFDMDGCDWGHDGPLCSFDTMLAKFGLQTEPLQRLANVIRAADTDQLESCPQAAGLLAISVGLSRAHKCDQAQLDAAMPLYDALYRWARDGYDEGHDT